MLSLQPRQDPVIAWPIKTLEEFLLTLLTSTLATDCKRVFWRKSNGKSMYLTIKSCNSLEQGSS